MIMNRHLAVWAVALFMQFLLPVPSYAQSTLGIGDWMSVSSNFDAGYRNTQFFVPQYNTALLQWDSHVEFWLPPFRKKFSWGPYFRVAGIKGSEGDAWQNAWLGGPGIGFQLYPLSAKRFRRRSSVAGKLLGPLRTFIEYNFTDYWGQENRWRPRNQTRVGFDYWKAAHVNDSDSYWWAEIWNGLYWQSANEFTDRYNSVIFSNSVRVGVRKAQSRMISSITPYIAVESSLSKYRRLGLTDCSLNPDLRNPQNPCDFFWENRLLAGGGLRFAPSLGKLDTAKKGWLTRFVIYGEYLRTATYYGPAAPSSFPRFDVRVGVSSSIGDWYK
jgi:hypothetical protein